MTRTTNQISAAHQAAIQAIVTTVQYTAPLLSAEYRLTGGSYSQSSRMESAGVMARDLHLR
jgi:hypothetical protein